MIAQEAGVANGSLFTYFETKTDLLNQLYLELKAGMASAALEGLPARAELREQLFHVWSNWMGWAVSNPEKRRALAQLGVSEEITPANRAAAAQDHGRHRRLAGTGSRRWSHARTLRWGLSSRSMNSLAEATMDFMVHDPANADKHCKVGFDALWRVLA